jgi:hypothetical protein
MQRYPIVLVNGIPQELPESDRIIHSANVIRSATAPLTPVEGDLWFNTSVNGLRVFDGTTWVVVVGGTGSSTVGVSATAPSPATNGLLWYDTTEGYLKIYLAATTSWVPCQTQLFVDNTQPTVGIEQGDMWYRPLTGTFSMYIGGTTNSWLPMGSQLSIADILAFG